MKLKIIIILVLIVSIDCVKITDFCHNQNKQECGGKYKFSCADILCAKNEKKCQSLTLMSNFSKFHKNKRDYNNEKKKFETFMRQIKECLSSYKMRY
jgi:hypothetical protein